MLQKTKKSKVISIFLTLCMLFGVLPGMGITASAANGVTNGVLTIDSTDVASGTGWDWDGQKLTLSGVNLSQIILSVSATIVLEGTNKVSCQSSRAIDTTEDLTIEGSGSLEVYADDNTIVSTKTITINSGYITIGAQSHNVMYTNDFTVNGGFVNALASSGTGINIESDYEQTAGYVKVCGAINGISATNISVSGGYLEAETSSLYNARAISCNSLSNSGGVIKASGTNDSSTGIEAHTFSFSGGVTIAKSRNKAIYNRSAEESILSNGEQVYDNSSGSPTVITDPFPNAYDMEHMDPDTPPINNLDPNTPPINNLDPNTLPINNLTSVIIAKSLTPPTGETVTLNGAYLCGSGTQLGGNIVTATVTGGSYIENVNSATESACTVPNLIVEGTLVAECKVDGGTASTVLASNSIDVEENGTLYGSSINYSGIGIGSSGTINNDGNLIASGNTTGIFADSATINVTDGYMCNNTSATTAITSLKSLTVSDGYLTSTAKLNASDAVSFSNNAAATFAGYSGPAITGAAVTGVTERNVPLEDADYNNNTYKVGDTEAKIIFAKYALPPIFDARNGETVTKDNYTSASWENYTLEGWYTGIDGTGEKLEGIPSAGKSYYAHWTNNGKTVRTNAINCMDFTQDESNVAQGWSWDNSASTLTLNNATINTIAAIALNAEKSITIKSIGENTIKSSCDTSVNSYGIYLIGSLTLDGDEDSVLNVYSGNTTGDFSTGISSPAAASIITINGGTVNSFGGKAAESSHGINSRGFILNNGVVTSTASTQSCLYANGINVSFDDIIINGGSLTAVGGNGLTECYGICASGTDTILEGSVIINNGTVRAKAYNASTAAISSIESLSIGSPEKPATIVNGKATNTGDALTVSNGLISSQSLFSITDDYVNISFADPTPARSSSGGTSSYFTITYNTNGGSKIESIKARRNTTISEPVAPTKDGYIFDGWYTDSTLSTKYEFTENVIKAFTLYAKWTEKPVDNSKNELVFKIGQKDVMVFGAIKTSDATPIIRNDRTMLPARLVAESLGATVAWDEKEQKVTITKGDITIIITIGSDKAMVNGEEVTLDSPAFIENGRTYTPLRFIAEKLGATVTWDEQTQKITITKK